MDIRELKDLLKNSTSVLILDDGEPSYVILDYQVYRNLIQAREPASSELQPGLDSSRRGGRGEQEILVKNHTQNSQLQHSDEVEAPKPTQGVGSPTEASVAKAPGLSAQEVEALERLNREIQALKDQIEQDEKQGGFQENQ